MNTSAPIYLALGRSQANLIAALLQDISQDSNFPQNLTIVTDSHQPGSTTYATALLFAKERREHHRALGEPGKAGTVAVVRPDAPGTRIAASLGLTRRYQPVNVASQAARFNSIRFRTDIKEAPALVAIGSIGSVETPSPLAVGIWTRYLDPRLAFPLNHPIRREPATADVALAIAPTLVGTLLTDKIMGYVVGVWSRDLIAAELAGLAVRTASHPDLFERIGPWEDPVVQRATELDLGAHLPSQLSLHPVWTGDADDAMGLERLRSLVSTVSTLLNIPDEWTVSLQS